MQKGARADYYDTKILFTKILFNVSKLVWNFSNILFSFFSNTLNILLFIDLYLWFDRFLILEVNTKLKLM